MAASDYLSSPQFGGKSRPGAKFPKRGNEALDAYAPKQSKIQGGTIGASKGYPKVGNEALDSFAK